MANKELISADKNLPSSLYIISIQGKPIFPGIFTPVIVIDENDIKVIEESWKEDRMLGLILTKESSDDGEDELYTIGTAARIMKRINLPDGGLNIFIQTVKRFKIRKILNRTSPIKATVNYLDDIFDGEPEEFKALARALVAEMKQLSEESPLISEEMRLNMVNIDNPGKLADFIVSILNIDRHQQQEVLETLSVGKRMEKALIFVRKEQELIKIQKQVSKQINDKIEKNQKEYFLREELKAIKRELGEPVDAKSSDHLKFKEQIEKYQFEGELKEQTERELEKFSLMDPSSSEYIVTRNYLEVIVSLPWEEPIQKEIDMEHGRDILEKDHYGLEDVKERILEYLAVRKLKKDTKGSIICLVGPPGVGKTSIGKSIARALDREFFRFSVGGMRDEAEIKGHRRTYIGAMPGKILQGLKIVKTKAPVFMIDEIDKLGTSFQGDPSSALLEVLDPEQNSGFRDHYLDLPFDLSYILFIATANTLDSIPRALLDRMEVIRLSGYIGDEKIEIAKQYIIPKSLKKHGLLKKHIRYNLSALTGISELYARDAGMRGYEKAIDKIHRKVAHKVTTSSDTIPYRISKETLEEYLGKPSFPEDVLKRVTGPGLAIGLAWTNFGGDTLIIEAVATPGKGDFRLTGQMGDVMKESASIAYTVVRKLSVRYNVDPLFFEKQTIHLHIPEGATPKDGPSAGITMATALLSLAIKKKVKINIAMTGELSLSGMVLPIGGLKEKTIAARRNKLKNIIIPEKNIKDLDEIPDKVKGGIEFHPVKTVEQVLEIVFEK